MGVGAAQKRARNHILEAVLTLSKLNLSQSIKSKQLLNAGYTLS